MLSPTFSLVARLTLTVAKHDLQPGQTRSLLTRLFSQKHAAPCATRQVAQRQAYGYTWLDEYRQGLRRHQMFWQESVSSLIQFACAAGWRLAMKPCCRTLVWNNAMQKSISSHCSILQHCCAERYSAEYKLKRYLWFAPYKAATTCILDSLGPIFWDSQTRKQSDNSSVFTQERV